MTWSLARRRRGRRQGGGRKSDAIGVNKHFVLCVFVFRTLRRLGNSVSVGRPRARRLSSMNWFRSRIRSAAQLALFALALQMIVSFGHMHRDDLGLPPLADTDLTSIASTTAPGSQAPAGQQHQPASDDYCPICASIALLASWMPVLPPGTCDARADPPRSGAARVLAKPADAILTFISSTRSTGRLSPIVIGPKAACPRA